MQGEIQVSDGHAVTPDRGHPIGPDKLREELLPTRIAYNLAFCRNNFGAVASLVTWNTAAPTFPRAVCAAEGVTANRRIRNVREEIA